MKGRLMGSGAVSANQPVQSLDLSPFPRAGTLTVLAPVGPVTLIRTLAVPILQVRWKLLCGVFLAAAMTAPAQKPDGTEQSRALAVLRDYALSYTRLLPDFICTQVIERSFGDQSPRA